MSCILKKVYLATLSKTNKQVTLAHTIGNIMHVTYRVAISVVGAVPLPLSLRSPSMQHFTNSFISTCCNNILCNLYIVGKQVIGQGSYGQKLLKWKEQVFERQPPMKLTRGGSSWVGGQLVSKLVCTYCSPLVTALLLLVYHQPVHPHRHAFVRAHLWIFLLSPWVDEMREANLNNKGNPTQCQYPMSTTVIQ